MFIAEIGINHNGDIDNALRLIDMAVKSECDVVKFQKRNPDVSVPNNYKNTIKETPWGEMTYLDYKHRIEFGKEEYDIIDRYCKEKGILWTASVWDIDSLIFIMHYDIPFIKVASAKITDIALLEAVKGAGKPITISTGMSTPEEIDRAVEVLNGCELTIMHCNSSYPAEDGELNLAYIPELKQKYPNAKIGYSGHEEGISACIVAKTLGADIFERHITLSRSMWGTDQSASLVYDQLWRLVRDLNKVDTWVGVPKKIIFIKEKNLINKLRGQIL